MTEKEKMLSGQLYDASDSVLYRRKTQTQDCCFKKSIIFQRRGQRIA